MPSATPCMLAALGVAVLVFSCANLPSQRGVRTLTSGGAADVRLSPDGNWIAFKNGQNGALALTVVSTGTIGNPTTLVTDKALTRYLWAPDSGGLYYQIGATLYYVRTVGGTPKQITTISGVNPRLWCVDSKDKVLIGTRSDSSGFSAIFTVPTDSSAFAKDILNSGNDYFDGLVIAPGDTRIAYTAQALGYPHAPIDVRAVDVTGANDGSLSGGPLPRSGVSVGLPQNLSWLDAGTTVLFTGIEQTSYRWAIWRVAAASSTPQEMTMPPQHFQRSEVSGDRSTVVMMATTFHGHTVPAVMSAKGGARIPLEPELDWVMSGPPSIDAGARKVAFAGYAVGGPSGIPELQLIELDREIGIEPRPELGKSLNLGMPLLTGESGTLFLSTGLLPADPKQQFKLPGITYAVAIDPTVLVPLISGVGNGGPFGFTTTVPNLTALVGFTVYLQGLRVRSTNPDQGDLTRYAELQFLK